MGWVIFFVVIGAIFAVIWLNKELEKKKKDEEDLEMQNTKQEFLNSNQVPLDCKKFQYISGYPKMVETDALYVWREGSFLNLLSENTAICKHQIPIDDIKYYSIKGDLRQETELTGDTKGLTAGQTMMAEGLLGTAVAMKRNQIISKIKNIDERRTIINAAIDGKDRFIFFEKGDLYNYLLEQMPEKEQSFVAMQKQ